MRKDCEQTNWYQHGKDAATKGQRLVGDSKIQTCQRAGASIDNVALARGFQDGTTNFCQPENVFQLGKKGEVFNEALSEELCGADHAHELQAKHQDGVRFFCQTSNGFAAGATGAKYTGVCPSELAETFVAEFNRGRKNYLTASVATNDEAIRDIEVQIGRLESQVFMLKSKLMGLPSEAAQSVVIVTEAYTGQSYAQGGGPDTATQARRSDLELEVQNVDVEIARERLQADSLREKSRALQVELTAP